MNAGNNTSIAISETSLMRLQMKSHKDGDLLIWVIYDHPKNFPTGYVVRPHRNGIEPLSVHFAHEQLHYVRDAMMNLGLTCFARAPDDDPCIVECWV